MPPISAIRLSLFIAGNRMLQVMCNEYTDTCQSNRLIKELSDAQQSPGVQTSVNDDAQQFQTAVISDLHGVQTAVNDDAHFCTAIPDSSRQ